MLQGSSRLYCILLKRSKNRKLFSTLKEEIKIPATPASVTTITTTTTTTSIPSDSWWSNFRRELREEFEPIPVPPGYVNTTLIDFEKWEALPPEVVREGFKRAYKEVTGDWIDLWKWFRGKYTEETPEEAEKKKKENIENIKTRQNAISNTNSDQDLTGKIDEHLTMPSTEDIRAAAFETMKRVKHVAADEELKGRVASVVADGLRVARDSLDEFLIGFEEGKALEEKKRLEAEQEAEAEQAQQKK